MHPFARVYFAVNHYKFRRKKSLFCRSVSFDIEQRTFADFAYSKEAVEAPKSLPCQHWKLHLHISHSAKQHGETGETF